MAVAWRWSVRHFAAYDCQGQGRRGPTLVSVKSRVVVDDGVTT
jgi:hypothetical protein